MLECKKCGVKIITKTANCPLCHMQLEDTNQADLLISYPPYEGSVYRNITWVKLLSFFSLINIFIATIVNILFYQGILWCIIVDACILYVWLMAIVTFKKKGHWGKKLLLHSISIICLQMIINSVIDRGEDVPPITWAISYGMPIITITFIALIVLLMIIKKQTRREFIVHLLILCVLGFIPLILVLFSLVEPIFLSIISAGLSYATIIGLMIFANRIVETEIKRKFHL